MILKLKKENVHRLMKILFSAVILQLLYISLCLWAHNCGVPSPEAFPPLYKVPEMLQCAAASAVLTLAGGFLLEFAEELCER